ncbi:MAG: tetratricopeptide repeat protein, partial [Planctomycetes bacterium]|nr:tetratricopeptide repeat protein [Planctomycetota bacterium]
MLASSRRSLRNTSGPTPVPTRRPAFCVLSLWLVVCCMVAGCNSSSVSTLAEGDASMEKGDYDTAIALYSLAIQQQSQLVDAYRKRGHAYFEKGEYEPAISDFAEVIGLAPEEPWGYASRGSAHLRV